MRNNELRAERARLATEFNRHGVTSELRDRWQEIWINCITSGTSASVGNYVLLEFAQLGWTLAAAENDWCAACQRISYLLKHPSCANLDAEWLVEPKCMKAESYLYTGQEVSACRMYTELLRSDDVIVTDIALALARRWLYVYCVGRPSAHAASEELAELVQYIAIQKGVSRRRCVALPNIATYGDLEDVLNLSYPKSHRTQVRYVAEQTPIPVTECIDPSGCFGSARIGE